MCRMWPQSKVRWVLIASGLHALSASVPMLLFPQLWLDLLLPPGAAAQCLSDSVCHTFAHLVAVLVIGYGLSYMLAGLFAGQAAALIAGAAGKTGVFVVLSRAYFQGAVSAMAFATGVSDLALAMLYLYILVQMRVGGSAAAKDANKNR